jgi:hypothetical protein
MEKIRALPVERQAEIEDFVDFIATRTRRLAPLDRLIAIAPALEAAGAPPITENEIDAEIDAARAARRGWSTRAHRHLRYVLRPVFIGSGLAGCACAPE